MSLGANLNVKNENGATALNMNCKLSYEFLVPLLIKAGDDVHAIDGIYETPLQRAAWTGNIKSAIGISQTNIGFDKNFLDDNYSSTRSYLDKYRTRKWNFDSTLNYKFSNRLSLRSCLMVNLMHYDFYQLASLHQSISLRELLNTFHRRRTPSCIFLITNLRT